MVYPDNKAPTNQADAQAKTTPDAAMDPQRLLPAGPVDESGSPTDETELPVLFLADRQHSLSQLRELLKDADEIKKRELTGQIVSFAPWDEIWTLITPLELKQELPQLGLSESLTTAWNLWLSRKLGA